MGFESCSSGGGAYNNSQAGSFYQRLRRLRQGLCRGVKHVTLIRRVVRFAEEFLHRFGRPTHATTSPNWETWQFPVRFSGV